MSNSLQKIGSSKPISFQKGPIFKSISNPAIWNEKGQTITMEKVPLILDLNFLQTK
jgi:hypothetical protein